MTHSEFTQDNLKMNKNKVYMLTQPLSIQSLYDPSHNPTPLHVVLVYKLGYKELTGIDGGQPVTEVIQLAAR